MMKTPLIGILDAGPQINIRVYHTFYRPLIYLILLCVIRPISVGDCPQLSGSGSELAGRRKPRRADARLWQPWAGFVARARGCRLWAWASGAAAILSGRTGLLTEYATQVICQLGRGRWNEG